MGYFKMTNDGYILGVARADGEGNINRETYNGLTEIIRNMPTAPEGFYYRLTEDLEWELYELKLPRETQEDNL